MNPLLTQIREKTQYGSPWRQTPRSRVSPDTEVSQIMQPARAGGGGARPKTTAGAAAAARGRPGLSPGTRPGLVSPGQCSFNSVHFLRIWCFL